MRSGKSRSVESVNPWFVGPGSVRSVVTAGNFGGASRVLVQGYDRGCDRSGRVALSRRRAAGRRWDGRSLPGRGHAPRPAGGAQVPGAVARSDPEAAAGSSTRRAPPPRYALLPSPLHTTSASTRGPRSSSWSTSRASCCRRGSARDRSIRRRRSRSPPQVAEALEEAHRARHRPPRHQEREPHARRARAA